MIAVIFKACNVSADMITSHAAPMALKCEGETGAENFRWILPGLDLRSPVVQLETTGNRTDNRIGCDKTPVAVLLTGEQYRFRFWTSVLGYNCNITGYNRSQLVIANLPRPRHWYSRSTESSRGTSRISPDDWPHRSTRRHPSASRSK